MHKIVQYLSTLDTHMKRGSNIAVKNVLQVYVTTTMIFYAIFPKKVNTSHLLTGAGGCSVYVLMSSDVSYLCNC